MTFTCPNNICRYIFFKPPAVEQKFTLNFCYEWTMGWPISSEAYWLQSVRRINRELLDAKLSLYMRILCFHSKLEK